MSLLETLGHPNFLLVVWIILAVWTSLFWIRKLDKDATEKAELLKFLHWDFFFVFIQTLTWLATISFFVIKIEYQSIWLFIPPIIYALADLAENILRYKAAKTSTNTVPEKTPIERFLTAAKKLFFMISIFLIGALVLVYFLKKS